MLDVLTIGTATRDVFLKSRFFKVLKDPEHLSKIGFQVSEAQCFALGSKVEVERLDFTTGGGATNAAVTFARQGFKTAAVFKIGNDEDGQSIVRELQKERIKTLPLKDRKYPTGYSIILLSSDGERTILVYRGASEDLRGGEIPLGRARARWAYIVPGGMNFEDVDSLVNKLFKSGFKIAINPSKRLIERKLAGLINILNKAKVVLMNREEAAYLTDINYDHDKRIFKKLDEAVPGVAVMTDGGRGVLVSDGHFVYRAGVFREHALVDRTGAGDAFGSGFVAGLIHKNEECEKGLCKFDNIEYAIRLGTANATSVIEYIGAKAGILSKRDFLKLKRWQNLEIEIKKLH